MIIPNDICSDLDSELLLNWSLHWALCVVFDQIMFYSKVSSPPHQSILRDAEAKPEINGLHC